MDDTITSDAGATDVAQPETQEAVTLGEAGAPTLRPKTAPTSSPPSQDVNVDEATEADIETQAPPEQSQPTEVQADSDDLESWAKKKGIDLETADPVKLAQMVRESEQRMHEATRQARQLETSMSQNPNLPYTGDENYDSLAAEVNTIKIQTRVENFFRANPEAREYENKMAEIVVDRPWLQNDLEALHALAVNSPDRQAELKKAGGREALTNLAQKQSAVPPQSNASTGVSSSAEKITSANVDSVVAAHMGDTKWYASHRSEIDRAMAGTR